MEPRMRSCCHGLGLVKNWLECDLGVDVLTIDFNFLFLAGLAPFIFFLCCFGFVRLFWEFSQLFFQLIN